ncbi:Putative phosphoenolpyruvate synthase/pyruvate phosphate dikinase, C-terminal domain [Alloactinosynnema sp. L-07]|uniref:PEP-utilizing enzyme n=1 Tax=Alloactinosynnema sp. L-07 TaxID=1653480 RepID=UPI00065F025B|nr:PEP-utilizing enzyme [Alloactinosynnema sp. L-07]CRK56586.1 Putative phosphoenolpyruvate synthase/pyruvate phosphate dikinase, C-terminal domain [Alloactinosynnema sp. L-07]
MADRFPSPFEIATPSGAEGWQQLYTYSALFCEERRDYEDGGFWFHDGVHWPEALTPWDTTFLEFAIASLSQYNTRHYMIPPAYGVDYRILNGYVFLSPVPAPAEEIESRVPLFMERAGFYFANWDRLYDDWLVKIRDLVKQMTELRIEPLPSMEDIEVITSGAGQGSGNHLLASYHKLLDLALTLWQYHFEFLNLGYAAYLDFFGFCKAAFPSIPDLAIAKMVAGVDVDLFRPDDELKKLARLAVSTGIDDRFTGADVAQLWGRLGADDAGRAWIAEWEQAAEPWFNFSTGSGFYHSDKIWVENVEVPIGYVTDYIVKVKDGVDLDRPVAALHAERDRVVSEYKELLDSDDDRAAFDAKLGLSRTVFPYVENHNFYVEHWAHSVLWRKMKDLGGVLVSAGFIAEPNDVFMFQRSELSDVLFDMYAGWAIGAPSRGPGYWPAEIQRRHGIHKALKGWSPPPALGVPPEVVTEPFTVMLWGITSDSVAAWLNSGEGAEEGTLNGFAASPGLVEGPARVISSADQIGEIQDGEILVAPLTAPSWAPVFGKIKATVTDVGGMMSHAAIVCREYGLPAVTGTAFGTKTIKTGQLIRVDGNSGTVTVID